MARNAGNVRFEYDIGEIVLCFEPDTTKARVLYEAKVIDQRTVKEPGGKKRPAYVVHFQGWNSSWDRQVDDKFLLRDTIENRELMRKLTDAAKKLKNSQRRRKINAILHQAFGGAPPEFGTVSDSDESDDQSEPGKKPGKGKGGPDKKRQKTSVIDFEIPESLRERLEDDYFLINKRNKLTRVPAKPCVVDILESFMKTFCVNYLCDPSGGREKTRTSSSKHTLKCPPDKCVSLCKEFVDSLRIIFDHTLPVVLLYAAEQQQYETVLQEIKPTDLIAKDKDKSQAETHLKGDKQCTSSSSHQRGRNEKGNKQQQRSESPTPSSHSSSRAPSPPRRVTRQAALEIPHTDSHEQSSSHHHHQTKSKAEPRSPRHNASSSLSPKSPRKGDKEIELSYQEPIIPIASRTRRRSQFDTAEISGEVQVKQEPVGESEHRHPFENLPSSSQTDEVYMNGQDVACSAAGTESLTMGSSRGREDAMDHILGWQLLPQDIRLRSPISPSQVYGTVHLLRMFVKLPDLLKKMNLKDVMLQIIVKFIHHCLQYMTDHQSELFHEQTYVKA